MDSFLPEKRAGCAVTNKAEQLREHPNSCHLKSSEVVWLHMQEWDTERTRVNEWFEDPQDNVCVLLLFCPYPSPARAVASFTQEAFIRIVPIRVLSRRV